jgi:endonuclease-8
MKAAGNTQKTELRKLEGIKITDFKSWGKHFLICLPRFTLRIHFLMFGIYRINESKKYLGKTNRRTFYCEVCQKLYV